MVFENVTLLEVHVDGTELDAVFGGSDDATVEDDRQTDGADAVGVEDAADDETPGAGRKRRYVAVLGLAVAGSVVARRLRRRRAGPGVGVDVDSPANDEAADRTASATQ